MNQRFLRPDHITDVMHDAVHGSRSQWVPDEVGPYAEERERRRAGGIPLDFIVVVEPDSAARWTKLESAQERLWNESVKQRVRARAPSYQAFTEENEGVSKWLTKSRKQHDFLREVPRTMQDALLGLFQAKLSLHYFNSGAPPERWTRSTLDLPLLRFTASQARVASHDSIKLQGLGLVQLRGESPLTADCEISKVHVARDEHDAWRARVYRF